MAIANISSNYDLEFIVSNVALEHLIHLFFDVGKIPPVIDLPDISITILTEEDSVLNRTYSPANNYVSAGTTPGAFNTNVLIFDEAPDNIYLKLSLFVTIPGLAPNPPGFPLDGYIKLPHIIDGQRFFEKLQEVIEGEADTFYLTPYAEVVSIQYGGTDFDPLDPQAGPSDIPGTPFDLDDFLVSIQAFLNTAISDALKAAKLEHDDSPESGNEIVNFVQSQIDLLGYLRLDEIALQAFPETNRLGLYANFILLDHDRGFVGNRGDKDSGVDFLGEDRHLAVATSPSFLSHLVDDFLIKAILKEDLENGDLQEWEIENRLLFEHYPIRFPYSLLSDGISAPAAYIKNVVLDTVNKKFRVADGDKVDMDALEITIKLDEYLFNLFELPSENLVVYAVPFQVSEKGLTTLDLYIETNLRLDLSRSLLNFTGPLGWIATGIVNLFLKKEMLEDTLSNLMGKNVLSTLPLLTERWDPFYETQHGLLLENINTLVQDNQLRLRFGIHLDKNAVPYEAVYVRDYESQGALIESQLYRVHATNNIVNDTYFATDREHFEIRPDDIERYIYALRTTGDSGSIEQRLENNKLVQQLIYQPYCIHQGEDNIEQIGLLTDHEFRLIHAELISAELERTVSILLERLLSVFDASIEDITPEDLEELYTIIRPSAELDPGYLDYVENEADAATYRTIITEAHRVRLRPTPNDLNQLLQSLSIVFPDYTLVRMSDGQIYFRNVANDSTDDNLLNKPSCPIA